MGSERDLRVAVAGIGRAGSAVLRECLDAAGVEVLGAWNRSPRPLGDLTARLGDRLHVGGQTPPPALQQADLLLLAISDRSVPELAGRLACGPAVAVVHLSGAADTSLLAALRSGVAGCWHPLQAFTASAHAPGGPPYAVALQGGELAVRRGRLLAERLGHPSVELAADGRAAYHAAAVLASNCLVALEATAVRVMGLAGVSSDDAWRLLWPLVHGTLHNLAGGPVPAALTGPVARGDAPTIERNLKALGGDAGAEAVYRALGLEAVRLAQAGSASAPGPTLLGRIAQILDATGAGGAPTLEASEPSDPAP
jgi:predicted short-subunit dehydrogenase-like oxidoreductase (DUF2520 family)